MTPEAMQRIVAKIGPRPPYYVPGKDAGQPEIEWLEQALEFQSARAERFKNEALVMFAQDWGSEDDGAAFWAASVEKEIDTELKIG